LKRTTSAPKSLFEGLSTLVQEVEEHSPLEDSTLMSKALEEHSPQEDSEPEYSVSKEKQLLE